MFVIGLTGGIAAGKSAVAARLAEHGAVIVDADALAREVVEPGTPALAAIAEHFGPSVIHPDGSLNRPALGAIIFSDAAARVALNGITHPAVWLRTRELFAAASASNPDAVVVYDVPLLVEAAEDRPLKFDLVVVVHASADTRIARLVELRGMSRQDAEHRLSSQATDAERLAVADVVITTDGSIDETMRQADALWVRVTTAGARENSSAEG